MSKRLLLGSVVSIAALLVLSGALAQPKGQKGAGQGSKGPSSTAQKVQRLQGRPRVSINGRESVELNRGARRVGGKITVPSTPLFRELGGDVKRERGWVPPGSRDPKRDRDIDWHVVKRGDRELRFRPGERLYYYGGRPRYFSIPPYLYGDSIYLPLGDIALLFGGRYNYDPYYDYGRVTLCEYGYCPDYGELRLVYPYPRQYFYGGRIPVQGYAPPYSVVRIAVYLEGYYGFGNRAVYSTTVRTNRNGLFDATVWVRRSGPYRLVVQSLDPYGRVIADRAVRFDVRY